MGPLRKLSSPELEKLASRDGVDKTVVINFLSEIHNREHAVAASMGANYAKIEHKWNNRTFQAILDGIRLAADGTDDPVPVFRMCGTVTGRLRSTEPNFEFVRREDVGVAVAQKQGCPVCHGDKHDEFPL